MPSFLKKYLDILKARRVIAIIFAALFCLGLIVGIITKNGSGGFWLGENVSAFYVNSLTDFGSVTSVFFGCFFTDLSLYALFFILSVSVYLLPVEILVIFYRGYVSGAVLSTLAAYFSFGGIMLYIFAVLVRCLFSTAGLVFYAVISLHENLSKRKNSCAYSRLGLLLACFSLAVIGNILQLLSLIFFLKPLNKNF